MVMSCNLYIILFYFRESYLTDDTYGRDIWEPYLFVVFKVVGLSCPYLSSVRSLMCNGVCFTVLYCV